MAGKSLFTILFIVDYALNRAKNPEVVERVQRGQILSQPGNCPIKVYEVRPIIKC